MKAKIERYLEKFPKNATSWGDATDEIRDLSRESRELLEDYDGITVEPVDFEACRTPVEWNTCGRENILANYDRMSGNAKQACCDRFREWFEADEPQKPWAMRMQDGNIEFFDTNEQMVRHSVKSGVLYQRMGKTEYIIND